MLQQPTFLITAVLLASTLVACGETEQAANKADPAPVNASTVAPDPGLTGEAAVASTIVAAGSLSLEDGMALAQKNNCLACHTLDKKLVGPAWIDVAKRYQEKAGSEHTLIIKVSTGGGGVWGDMPMPAMAPAVKEEDIRTLVQFILSLRQ